jgi:hypothetical protein
MRMAFPVFDDRAEEVYHSVHSSKSLKLDAAGADKVEEVAIGFGRGDQWR